MIPLRLIASSALAVFMASGCAARSLPTTIIADSQLAVTLTAPCPSPNPAGTPAPCGELGILDKFFMDAYQAAQDYTKAHHGPVVLVSGSSLTLVLEGKGSLTARVIPDLYHALKAVAHFPFAIYLTLASGVDGPFTQDARRSLETFIAKEPAARSDLDRFELSMAQVARQYRILDTVVGFVRLVLSGATVSREQLDKFARGVGPLLLENTRDAGCAQVLSTHRQMLAWKAAEPSLEWSSL